MISNGNLLYSKDSNPINEEIEFYKENYIDNNDYIKENDKYENNKEEQNTNYNFYFKDLISILNQKFKKYAPNDESEEKAKNNNEIKIPNIEHVHNDSNKNIQNNQNIITISNKKHNKIYIDKPLFINTSKEIYSKKNHFKEDSDFSLLETKINTNINKNLSPKNNNNLETIVYNIKDMTSHYNNFLDISTNYDPGIDSKGNSSIERTDSINKNELKNFSLSLDKKKLNKMESDSTDKNKIKKNKFKKDISEQDKFSKNKFMNKNGKNKYLPFYEKKVCINLSNTFGNLSKSENKNKKK